MALNPTLSNAAATLAADAVCATLNSGFLDIYDSTGTGQPATPDTAVTTQVKLARLALNSTAFGGATNGVATANAIVSDAAADATGTPTWCRAVTSGGTAVFDGSAGASGCNLNLSGLTGGQIVLGGVVGCSAFTYTQSKT
jgi:hypothetical protein